MIRHQWTAPYFGVQHLNMHGKKSRVSVCDYGTFAEVHLWFPGCGFSPINRHHDSAELARADGEKWIESAA
jgi:hypothetical protein